MLEHPCRQNSRWAAEAIKESNHQVIVVCNLDMQFGNITSSSSLLPLLRPHLISRGCRSYPAIFNNSLSTLSLYSAILFQGLALESSLLAL